MTADPASVPLPRQFGDYELLAEVGRGGFGTIYKARQCCLNRLCAVKMLHAQNATADAALTSEAQAAASLDHPHIVGIYEVGREEGRLFFSMEFVEGQNLSNFTRTQIISAQRVATYVRKIAEAIHYAHTRGVLHCDLKPANVIIDPHDEPQITDFGLARQAGPGTGKEPDAEGAGSPNFMAPEQCDAHFGEVSQQTDVFGVGAVLYYLLTDRPPFRGETFKDTIRAVTQLDPVRPRTLRPGVPLDLETICLRCLEKRPAKRYRDGKEIADELGRFLNDEPIHARAINPAERLWRRARRHPWLASFAAATLVLLVVLAVGSTLAAMRIDEARQVAETERQAVELLQRRTAQNLYAADLALAFEAWGSGNDRRAREILERHRPADGAADLRGWEWRFLAAQCQADFQAEFPAHPGEIRQVELVGDGDSLLASDTANRLRLWSVRERKVLAEITARTGGSVRFAAARAGDRVAVAARPTREANTTIRILSLPDFATNATFTVPGAAAPAEFTPDGKSLWVFGGDVLRLCGLPEGNELRRFPLPTNTLMAALAFAPDGSRLATGEDGGTIALMATEDGKLLARVKAHDHRPPWEDSAYVLRFSADGSLLASGGGDGTVRLWDGTDLTPRGRLSGHQDLVSTLAFSPDNRLLISAGRDPSLFVWDLAEQKLIARPKGHGDLCFGLQFLPDGTQFLSAGNDRVIRLWEPRAESRWRTHEPLPADTFASFIFPGGQHFMTSPQREGLLHFFQLSDGTEFATVPVATDELGADFWTGPGNRLVGASYRPDGTVRVSDPRKPDEGFTLSETNWVRYELRRSAVVSFNPDGAKLAVADASNGLRVWDLATRQISHSFAGIRTPRTLQFSHGGQLILIAGNSGAVQLADLATGREFTFAESVSLAHSVVFSRDDRYCVVPGFDGVVRVFETATGQLSQRLTARAGSLLSVAFSPDGSRLFAGSLDGNVAVWDLATGRELASAKVHQGSVFSVGFTADGQFVSAGPDAIRIWQTADESSRH